MDMQNAVAPPPTLGEARVRVKFNVVEQVAERKNVDAIKYDTAKLIDFCSDAYDIQNKKK